MNAGLRKKLRVKRSWNMLAVTSKDWKHLTEKEKSEWRSFYNRIEEKREDMGDHPWDKYKNGHLPKRGQE